MEWNLFCSVSSIGQIIWVDALSSIYKELQSFGNTFTLIFIRTLAERKWHRHVVVSLSPGENGREHLEVFHKCTFFWSSPMIIIYPGYLPHLLTNFFFMASLLAKVEWGGEPLDLLESHQGTGQQGVLVLKKTGAVIWGEGPYQDRWWFIMWSHIYLPWVSSNARQASRIQSHLKTFQL